MTEHRIAKTYELAGERYAELGVDVEDALRRLAAIPISLHCWQGDDVGGFEKSKAELGGGLQVTGGYPGRARNADELRNDIDQVLALAPGRHRLNLHACYLENGGRRVNRDAVAPEHFQGWIDWAGARGLGLDFNPTFFAHEKASDGLTLSHPDKAIRDFWRAHAKACRRIAAEMGRQTGTPCLINFWMPDGSKDTPVDRLAPRRRMAESLDDIFSEPLDGNWAIESLESKLFGIGAESYTVVSHEFAMGYALSRRKWLCLDTGHFHPTEVVSDKISALLDVLPGLLLHVSRPVRWDSDHVIVLDDEVRAIAQQIVRCDQLDKLRVGLDFFDASINRVAAWVIGARTMRKALLLALLEPSAELKALELAGDYTGRLALLEECKTLPAHAVWDHYCLASNAPVGLDWLKTVRRYEADTFGRRSRPPERGSIG